MNKTARILIVEDDPLIATDIKRTLSKFGHKVSSVATSGERAVKNVSEEPPDLVLMDINLPGTMDGIDTADRIHADHHIPIIYLTAHSNESLLERAKLTSPCGYLLKPFREKELQAAIEMALHKHDMESRLQETNRRLEQEITERKRMERELQKAKEAADIENQAKSEFLAIMSHELRTPLNSILGYAQILSRDESLTEKQHDAIGIIQHSGDHLLSMINEILDLAKIEAQKIELESMEFHLPELLNNIAEMVRIRAYRKGITFTAEIVSDLSSFVYGDEKRLRQILLNLLSNAVKFTEEGNVIFRVSHLHPPAPLKEGISPRYGSQESPLEGGRGVSSLFCFEVEDTGYGIPPEKIEKIFLPFQQVGDKRTQSEGTGLGLAISRHLVRMMGGELQVKSASGKGSTFSFQLDLPEVDSEDSITNLVKQYCHIVGVKGRKYTILLVDDNDGNRGVLKNMLLPIGFEIIEALDGHDALEKTREYQPDAILMDLMMPVMDGFETIRRIRKAEDREQKNRQSEINNHQSSIVIVGVSASAFEQTRKDCLAAGCDDFIVKPVKIEILLKCLQLHLKLEWIYEDKKDGHHLEGGGHTADAAIIPPPLEKLARMNELAMIGDIMEIRKCIGEIETLDPKFKPFAARLRKFAKTLNILDIQQYLQQCIEKRP